MKNLNQNKEFFWKKRDDGIEFGIYYQVYDGTLYHVGTGIWLTNECAKDLANWINENIKD